ncbi:hypothetical protein XHC_4199 [Xanthomonas hortorum pv. carotae str. M081]|nr:hypothetical protein XHC_4199 [Xanthomonas hortorum pv. carotae str. M081]
MLSELPHFTFDTYFTIFRDITHEILVRTWKNFKEF